MGCLFRILNHCKEGRVSMKSCFLLLALGAILFQSAYAQGPMAAVKQANDDKATFDQFYEKLKIFFHILLFILKLIH